MSTAFVFIWTSVIIVGIYYTGKMLGRYYKNRDAKNRMDYTRKNVVDEANEILNTNKILK